MTKDGCHFYLRAKYIQQIYMHNINPRILVDMRCAEICQHTSKTPVEVSHEYLYQHTLQHFLLWLGYM